MKSSNSIISKTLTRAMLSACLAGGVVAYSNAATAGEGKQHNIQPAASESTSNTQAANNNSSAANKIQQQNAATNQQQNVASDQQQNIASTQKNSDKANGSASLEQVDQNQDASLVWTEIYAVYDDELADAGWEQDYVFNTYDLNNDDVLNEDEYTVFIGGLTTASEQASQNNNATAGTNQNQQASQQANQQSDQQARQQAAQSATQSGSQGADQAAEAPVVVSVVAITEMPVLNLEDREVINYRGESVGEVEQVVTNPDGTISGLVVGVGGFWDIGDKDVFVPASELQAAGDYVVWETFLDEDTLEDMPQYQLEEYSAVEN